MKKIKKLLFFSTLGLSLGLYSCTDAPRNNNEGKDPNNGNTTKNESSIPESHIKSDREIISLLKSASSPVGVRPVTDHEGMDPNDGIPIIVEDEDTKSEEKTIGEYNGKPGYWVTSKIRYKMSQEFDETIIKDPSADILYPGCVIRGESIADATYAFFNACNTGLSTYSLNATLRSGDGSSLLGRAENIRMSDYRAQFSNWTHLDFNNDALKTSFSMYHINSVEDAKFHAGASVKHAIAEVVGSLDFKFNKRKNHFLVKFVQQKFNVVLDQPRGRATIFTSIDPEMMGSVQPVYISNINYGRILYMAVSTDQSETAVSSAIECMLKKIKGLDISVQLEQNYNKVISTSDISVSVIGGNHDQQNHLYDKTLEGALKYMQSNPTINEVAPISFQMRYAVDGSIARIVSKTEYEIPNKIFVPEFDKVVIKVKPVSIRATGGYHGENEIFGQSTVEANNTSVGFTTPTTLFNIDRSNVKRVNNKNVFTDLEATGSAQFTFSKSKGDNADKFLLSKTLTFKLNLKEKWNSGGDRAYSPVTDSFNLSELIKMYNNDSTGPYFVISTQSNGYTVGVKYQIVSVDYLLDNNKFSAKVEK